MMKTVVLILAMFGALSALAEDRRQVTAEVMRVTADFGNIDTDLGFEQVGELGLARGDSFTVEFKDSKFEVQFGDTYSDVPTGKWVAFITDMGNLRIARNFENAAATLGVKEGDTITLSN